MPGSQHRALKLTALVAVAQAAAVVFSARAFAEPSPTPTKDDPCSLIAGPAKDYCERGEGGGSGGGGGTPDTLPSTLDPLSSLAKGCADAAAWTVDTLSDAVKNTADVDFTNDTFLKQYAVVFAASAFLTLILWLLAVAKRAVRGVPLTTALSEAVGFLWLTVLASAFTPLILYTVVSATDAVTDVLAKGTGDQTDTFFGTFSQALKQGNDIGGGPIMLILVSFVSIIAAGVLYLELYLRAVLLYVGALLGVVVYAGLVDKNLWGHVRRWAGIMIAVIMVKPVIVIVLGLAGALTTADGPDSVAAIVSGLAIILLAIFASAMIYRFVPGFGDEIANGRNNRIMQGAEGKAAAVISSPANLVAQGIRTHSSRHNGDGGGGQSSSSAAARPSNPARPWTGRSNWRCSGARRCSGPRPCRWPSRSAGCTGGGRWTTPCAVWCGNGRSTTPGHAATPR